jgi:hypothetical protein
VTAAVLFARSGVESGCVYRRCAWTARKVEQRLRFCLLIKRRQDDDVQIDRSTSARFPVFKNRQFTAEQFLIDPI